MLKLLLDENLSRRVAVQLAIYADVQHVQEIGLAAAEDVDIWKYARAEMRVIISKDRDFADLALLHGAPPKVIRLRIGNCSWRKSAELLTSNWRHIEEFCRDEVESLLVISVPEGRL